MSFFSLSWAKPVSIQDDLGNTFSFKTPPRRILALSPHLTEWVFSLKKGDALVGRVKDSDYPAAARQLPLVGEMNRLDIETILQKKPDLILVWTEGAPHSALQRFKAAGIPLFFSHPQTLDSIPKGLETLGQLLGVPKEGAQIAQAFRQKKMQLIQRYANKKTKKRVFYQIWDSPLYTLNGQHMISEAIELCGGQNIFSALPTLAPQISEEAVVSNHPEIILIGDKTARYPSMQARWARYPYLVAVQKKRIYSIDPDLLHRPTVRFLEGMEKMCQLIQS